mmetsp:Transcript_72216/g.169234  ORF Transcript_72216/g.169234 Transcript_72216/m.169234 type:complete len:296 (-) Transcript_72216:993-1880(-)
MPDDEVREVSPESGNRHIPKYLEQDRGALQQAELKDVGGHETQGPVCSRTVVVGVHGNQYIGSFVEVTHDLLHALQTTAAAGGRCPCNIVFIVTLATDLRFEQGHEEVSTAEDCQDDRSEEQTPEMVRQPHKEGSYNREAGHPLLSICQWCVVPDDHRVGSHKGLQGKQQLPHPKHRKAVVDNVKRLILRVGECSSDAFGHVLSEIHLFNFSSRDKQRGSPQEDDEDNTTNDSTDRRQQYKLRNVIKYPNSRFDCSNHEGDGVLFAAPEASCRDADKKTYCANDQVPIAIICAFY